MSEVTDLVVIEKANAMTVFQSADQIEEILQKVEREVMSFVPDITTAKGRKEIASLAYKVAQTKTYLDGLGKDLVAELKEIPKLIDANRKTVRDRLDELKAKARQPLTDYEEEQARIKAEEAKAAAEALAKQIESDHEIAILMDREFDRQREEARLKAEQEKREHEERLKREAEEKARAEAEAKAKAEIEAAARREAEAKAAAERAERERIESEQRAQREAKEAAERAEREKQAAIEAERRKAQEEAERIRREAEAKEQARIAEEKRIKEEEERRAKDKAHRKEVNNKILADLIKVGASEDVAKNIITAIVKGEVFATKITY
ncbi:TPA: cell envelope biogenesis protein TolA [Escherichia coli]